MGVKATDITTGIARASMEMASARLTAGVQMAMLKNIMEVQQDTMTLLLQSMGLGQNLNILA